MLVILVAAIVHPHCWSSSLMVVVVSSGCSLVTAPSSASTSLETPTMVLLKALTLVGCFHISFSFLTRSLTKQRHYQSTVVIVNRASWSVMVYFCGWCCGRKRFSQRSQVGEWGMLRMNFKPIKPFFINSITVMWYLVTYIYIVNSMWLVLEFTKHFLQNVDSARMITTTPLKYSMAETLYFAPLGFSHAPYSKLHHVLFDPHLSSPTSQLTSNSWIFSSLQAIFLLFSLCVTTIQLPASFHNTPLI